MNPGGHGMLGYDIKKKQRGKDVAGAGEEKKQEHIKLLKHNPEVLISRK